MLGTFVHIKLRQIGQGVRELKNTLNINDCI